MDEFARLGSEQRRDVFADAAAELGLLPAIVEKDFWVCFVLQLLFTRLSLRGHFVFKGGTSLSKAYRLIQRFSEDIDLILDWQLLGYESQAPLQAQSSKAQQDKFNKELNRRAGLFISEQLTPELAALLAEIGIGLSTGNDPADLHVINVIYPAAFPESYIRPVVRLEIGPLGSWVPSEYRSIRPYAADVFPHLFSGPDCTLRTISAERTFWEKATILHQEAHRTGVMPQRHSRHYYDLHQLALSPIRNRALQQMGLLRDVVQFKQHFYPSSWARYDLAIPGSFRLLPTSGPQAAALKKDYEDMAVMVFGDRPRFDSLLTVLGQLEADINSLKS